MSPSQTRPIEPRSEDAAHQGETPMIIVRYHDDSLAEADSLAYAAQAFYADDVAMAFEVDLKAGTSRDVTEALLAEIRDYDAECLADREHERYESAAVNFLRGAA